MIARLERRQCMSNPMKDPVVAGIHAYLKRDKRDIRMHVSVNAEEYALIKECAAKAGVCPATFVRAGSLFAAAMYYNARTRKANATQPSE